MDFFGWEDLDGDGHVDEVESLLADDLMCTNDEEREMNAGIGWKVVLTAMWMRNFMMDWK